MEPYSLVPRYSFRPIYIRSVFKTGEGYQAVGVYNRCRGGPKVFFLITNTPKPKVEHAVHADELACMSMGHLLLGAGAWVVFWEVIMSHVLNSMRLSY